MEKIRGDDLLAWKKQSAFAGALLLALGTVTAMKAPASASYFEEGVSFSGRIVRDSVRYNLRIKVIEAMGTDRFLRLSLSKVRDPSGPTRLRQEQAWTYDLEEGDFYWEDDTFHVEAGNKGGAFDLHVHAERRSDARCSERQPLFVSMAQDGEFRIETGNATFGTITELPKCAKVWSYGSGPLPGTPCPRPGAQLWSTSLNARRPPGGDDVRVGIYLSKQRTISGQEAMWSANLAGTLPAERFRLQRDLDASLAGGAPWLSGRARLDAAGARTDTGWYNCRGSREGRVVSRNGDLRGDLTLDVIGYEPHRIRGRHAVGQRAWVRPRR